MQQAQSISLRSLAARAVALGERLEAPPREPAEMLARRPLTLRVGESGCAVLLRFGAVVFLDVDAATQAEFLRRVEPCVTGRFEAPETETAEIVIDPERGDAVEASGALVLADDSLGRLQVVAHALAKSAVLSHYEDRVGRAFDRVEELARNLGRGGRPARSRELLRDLGSVLTIQARTVGRVEVTEKPEITWEQAALDRLYEHLAAEYELRDRDRALSRKLDLVSGAAETYLELLHNRRSIRVEWYIVLLIGVEIVLSLYELLRHR